MCGNTILSAGAVARIRLAGCDCLVWLMTSETEGKRVLKLTWDEIRTAGIVVGDTAVAGVGVVAAVGCSR